MVTVLPTLTGVQGVRDLTFVASTLPIAVPIRCSMPCISRMERGDITPSGTPTGPAMSPPQGIPPGIFFSVLVVLWAMRLAPISTPPIQSSVSSRIARVLPGGSPVEISRAVIPRVSVAMKNPRLTFRGGAVESLADHTVKSNPLTSPRGTKRRASIPLRVYDPFKDCAGYCTFSRSHSPDITPI